jgi:hypothetical protein
MICLLNYLKKKTNNNMEIPKVVYREKVLPHSWCRWFNYQTHNKNSNNLVSVVGKTGSGKTWSAISICEIMSQMDGIPFTIDHIVFSLTELMELINSGTLKKGSKIVFDEPQVSIGAREFQSEANKVFNYLLSTFRHRNLSLFFCTPFENLLDKSTRRLFHVKIETAGINIQDNTCKLVPAFIEHVDFRDEPYRKRLLVIFPKPSRKGYATTRIDSWNIPKPSPELINLYEEKKKKFTDNLNKNIQNRLSKYNETEKSMTKAQPKPELVEVHIEPNSRQKILFCLQKGILKAKDIAKETGLGLRRVQKHLESIRNEQFLTSVLQIAKNEAIQEPERLSSEVAIAPHSP